MTSRQRVAATLDFKEPDRTPIDLGAMRASGINCAVYTALKHHLGIRTPTKVLDTMQILAEVEPAVLERLHVDVVPLDVAAIEWTGLDASAGVEKRLFDGTCVRFAPGTNITEEKDGSWLLVGRGGAPVARMPKDGLYFDFIRPTMSGCRIDPAVFQPSYTVPDEELELLGRRVGYLFENTDKAVLGWGACLSLVGLSAILADNITQGALDEWLVMLMTEKETAHDMMGRYTDAVIAKLKLYHEAVGERCVAWGVGSDDAGTQRGGLLAPELFEEMIKPYYKRVCDWVHAHTTWKTFLHSCGSIYDYIGHWIDAGVDILNPVQISAARMEPERLKRDFAGRIVFWGGGCDTQQVLPLGSPDEVRRHVEHNIEVFRPGGGYVFTQVHNIQQNVPVANVLAMFQAAHECG